MFCRELDRVKVKGKDQAVTIYEPLGLKRSEIEHRKSDRRGKATFWKKLKGAYILARHGEQRRGDRRQGSADLLVDPSWEEIKTMYEHALGLYQQGDFDGADKAFDHVLALRPGDGPSKMMKSRIEKMRIDYAGATTAFDPVYKFDEK